jgi:hypothetical protein
MPLDRSKLTVFVLLGALVLPASAFAQDVTLEESPPPVTSGGGGSPSWDAKFAGISGNHFQAEIGFPGMPKVGYHLGLSDKLEIGGAFMLGLAYYAPDAAVTLGMYLSVPIRLALSRQNNLSMALLFEPGLAFYQFDPFRFGILLNAGFNVGYAVNQQFVIGGGIDFPLGISFTNGTYVAIPILFGPVIEIHPTPQLGVIFDAKFGPNIYAGSGASGTVFGMKIHVGIAYRL